MNDLLFWLSARGQGSWAQFKSAVEELHLSGQPSDPDSDQVEDLPGRRGLSTYYMLRLNLQRLGHAEFFAQECADGWRVAPPVIATARRENGRLGVVCGARSVKLLQRLERAAAGTLEIAVQEGCPDVLRILAPDNGLLEEVARIGGVLLQRDASLAILASLPSIDDARRGQVDLPIGRGWAIQRFSADALGWRAAGHADTRATSMGLFRFSLRFQQLHFLCSRGATYRIPVQIGKYLVLKHHRRRVVEYERARCRLSVPAVCRPPLLVERALVLCSGSPPTYDEATKRLTYDQVPEDFARMASDLLRQELR